MIDVAALNAYIVWSKKYPEWRQKDRSPRRSFSRELSIQLAEDNVQERKVYNTGQNIPIKSAIDMFLRETEKNLPGPNPNQELGEIQANTSKRCVVISVLENGIENQVSFAPIAKKFISVIHRQIRKEVLCPECGECGEK
ncbi:hypothetical protein JTB14_024102 [Gonioctena quinquepunctata]|nr:hypothetical protein JTB14_024102 [Gonioctena quinquepunctata]